jgi:hypothetical protein
MVGCPVIARLFIGAVCCAILANIAGLVAWRGRQDGLGPWEWMTDPTAFWRSSNFKRPYAPARDVTFALSILGAIALCLVVVIVMHLQRGGATSVCGFSF